jgi:hypothetical protein
LQVYAEYLAELTHLGRLPPESRRNTLFRLSTPFQAFDFIVFDATGTKASFISPKTGARDDHQNFTRKLSNYIQDILEFQPQAAIGSFGQLTPLLQTTQIPWFILSQKHFRLQCEWRA